MKDKKERCIVVGAGGIAGAWFPPLKEEGIEVGAIVDLDVERARKRAADYELDCLCTNDLGEALTKAQPVFAVDLTVPEAHAAVTIQCLEAGVHVVGEKPMANSMDEARQMVLASEKAGRLYRVSQSRRWDPLHDSVRRTVAAGGIGDVTTVNCDFYIGAHFGGFRDEMPSPLILDMAIHHFDLARFLSGLDAENVYAVEFNPKGSWYKGDVAATCVFTMQNGVVFTYRGSWCSEGFHTSWNGDWRIIGSQGTLIYEQDGQPRAQAVAGNEGFHRPLADVQIETPTVSKNGMHGALLEMLAYLREGKVPQTECHDNIKSLAMVFAAIDSAKVGARVPVKV